MSDRDHDDYGDSGHGPECYKRMREQAMKPLNMVDDRTDEQKKADGDFIPEPYKTELDRLRAELKQTIDESIVTLKLNKDLRAENAKLKADAAEYLADTDKTIANLIAENQLLFNEAEKVKPEFEIFAREIEDLQDALALKNAALDRLEWARCNVVGTPMFCFACGVIEDTDHKPDCWWQAARKAGHE